MTTPPITLRQRADQYLMVRRALGYKLVDTEHLLMQFIDHLEHCGATTITTTSAVDWAAQSQGKPNWQRRRFSVVRGFARHLHALDPACEVPPDGLLRCFRNRPVPHLYSDAEIQALMHAAETVFRRPLRKATYRTLIGLLAVTGMRAGPRQSRDLSVWPAALQV